MQRVRSTNRAWLTTELPGRRSMATSPFDRRLILAPALRRPVPGRAQSSVRVITSRAAHGPVANAVWTIPAGWFRTTIRHAFSTADASEAYFDCASLILSQRRLHWAGGAFPRPGRRGAPHASWPRLLGRPASESGKLRHGDDTHGSAACRRRGARVAYALESFR